MRDPIIAILVLAFGGPEPAPAQDRPLLLRYLANMGVLLERGGQRVVIDGFHHGALAEYPAVPGPLLAALEQAGPPFTSLDLAMTTHRHLDHFDAASVAARLRSDSAVRYLAARETVDSLVARSDVRAGHPRVLAVVPPEEGGVDLSVRGVTVRVLDLPHNSTRSTGVANVGFLVTIGGATVLHVGDADPSVANFAPHRLPARGIDVAILPSWYFTGRRREAILGVIGARHYVASHIPLADTAEVRRQIGQLPNLTILATPGASFEIPIRAR